MQKNEDKPKGHYLDNDIQERFEQILHFFNSNIEKSLDSNTLLDKEIDKIETLFERNGKTLTIRGFCQSDIKPIELPICGLTGLSYPSECDILKIRKIYNEWVINGNENVVFNYNKWDIVATVATWKYYKYLLKYKVIKYKVIKYKNQKYKGENGYIDEHYGRYVLYINAFNDNRLHSGNDGNNLEEYELMVEYKVDTLKNKFENKYAKIELKEKYLDKQIKYIEALFGFNDKDISEDYLQTQPFLELFFEKPPLQRMLPKDVFRIREIHDKLIVEENPTQTMLNQYGKGIVINTVKTYRYYDFLIDFRKNAPTEQNTDVKGKPLKQTEKLKIKELPTLPEPDYINTDYLTKYLEIENRYRKEVLPKANKIQRLAFVVIIWSLEHPKPHLLKGRTDKEKNNRFKIFVKQMNDRLSLDLTKDYTSPNKVKRHLGDNFQHLQKYSPFWLYSSLPTSPNLPQLTVKQ